MIDLTGQTINIIYKNNTALLEEWKPIKIDNVVGKYMISSYGRVKSLERLDTLGKLRKEKLLRWRKNGSRNKERPYYHVCLCNGTWKRNFKIHRLVATHFSEGYFEGATVNHIDGNKENNHASNLEWVTLKENCQHRNDTGLLINARGTKQGSNKLSEEDVTTLYIKYLMGKERDEWVAGAIGREYGVNGRAILNIYRKEAWSWLTDAIDLEYNS